jgi:CubicO group peptidase (beta-lactamase class C family)
MAALLPDTERALRHRLATGQVRGRAPSVVGAVVRDGRPVWADGYGSVDGRAPDDDVQYAIGSITKTFVALLVLRLRDEGKLGLGDPLEEHLAGTAAGQATIGQLLAHTAGLVSEPPGPWWELTPGDLRPELSDLLPDPAHVHPAGRRHHYSNPGFALLGALVEKLRGRPWHEVLRREVLEPLGMDRTSLHPAAPHAQGWAVHPWADVLLPQPLPDLGRMAPAGQLWSTAADLGRFAAFLLDGDDRIVRPETPAEMRVPGGPTEKIGDELGYGLGLQLMHRDGRRLAGHTGSLPGFVATVWTSPADGLGAVALANTTSGLAIGGLAADLLAIVADREPRIPEPWRALPEVDQGLLGLTGPWYRGSAPFVLRLLADGYLELANLADTGEPTRLRPTGDGGWRGLNGYYAGELLQVKRDAGGAVTHLDLGTFVFTRQPYEPADVVPGGVDPAGWRTIR